MKVEGRGEALDKPLCGAGTAAEARLGGTAAASGSIPCFSRTQRRAVVLGFAYHTQPDLCRTLLQQPLWRPAGVAQQAGWPATAATACHVSTVGSFQSPRRCAGGVLSGRTQPTSPGGKWQSLLLLVCGSCMLRCYCRGSLLTSHLVAADACWVLTKATLFSCRLILLAKLTPSFALSFALLTVPTE